MSKYSMNTFERVQITSIYKRDEKLKYLKKMNINYKQINMIKDMAAYVK
jgi:hypothetical protein